MHNFYILPCDFCSFFFVCFLRFIFVPRHLVLAGCFFFFVVLYIAFRSAEPCVFVSVYANVILYYFMAVQNDRRERKGQRTFVCINFLRHCRCLCVCVCLSTHKSVCSFAESVIACGQSVAAHTHTHNTHTRAPDQHQWKRVIVF